MGIYLRFGRVGKVLEATVIGVTLLLLAVWGGQYVHHHAELARMFTVRREPLAWAMILYGLAASVLPIWLLLAPRDYLSTFMKLGTIFALVCGISLLLPHLQMPAISRFVDGSGPVVPGKLFPFCFITIACGSISGFHSLIASGTTPKIITREGYARPVGYGAMCLESLVAIMAIIAACALQPGVYLSMNMSGAPEATVAKVNAWNFPVTTEQMAGLAKENGEKTLFGRTGGAATLAVGMSQIFSTVTHGHGMDLWYHFAIMFEALFILTTLDAGTRVGRYLLQEMLGGAWRPLGDTRNLAANVAASVLMVSAWGWFLIQGVRDPNGGINSLWPLFGIANQMLAGIALCLATTIILKMQLSESQGASARPPSPKSQVVRGRPILALVTLVPLIWLLAVTMTAGWQKIFADETRPGFPRVGVLQMARELDEKLPVLTEKLASVESAGDAAVIASAQKAVRDNRAQRFNYLMDAVVAGFFMLLVAAIAGLSAWEWVLLLMRQRPAALKESEAVWLPEYAVAESRPVRVMGILAVGCALAKELSGEAQMARAQAHVCECHQEQTKTTAQIYVETAEKRFKGVNRCC
jgi:carbon starvation protein